AKREPFYLAHHENSFGRTLGYYGVGPGPYLYIPILGPTTVRDLADNAQGAIWPGPVGRPFDRGYFSTTATAIDGIDQRERNDAEINAMFRDSIDKYASFRSNFLQDRKGEIEALKARKGQTRLPAGFDDPLIDPAATAEPER
ncbi:MAG: MlaA family lipoprotein, partial [Novosphingobium sp.]